MQIADTKDDSSVIRKQAEEKLLEQSKIIEAMTHLDVKFLATELGTHQIELEMQNEELRRTQMELESLLTRYQELYDFAPVGYFTFDEKGLIHDVNLTGAIMLGVQRGFLIGRHFNQFIDSGDQDTFYLRLRSVFSLRERETWEIKVKRPDGSLFYAQLESACTGPDYCRAVLSDITKRKLSEIIDSNYQDGHSLTFTLIVE
jgi:two-component system, cell cycle sensor histidine kinase and response regulator CckA